jgi:hypothetical protein
MRALLRREAAADEVDSTQRDGLELYGWMVDVDRTSLLGDQFPELRRACAVESPERFSRLMREYLRAHPPTHWDTVSLGRMLPSFLETRADLPAFYRELADLAWTRRAANLSTSPLGVPVLDESLFVRLYAHDLFACLGVGAVATPPLRPTVVILGRSLRDGHPVVVRGDAARVHVLAAALGPVDPVPWRGDPTLLERAREELQALDLLPSFFVSSHGDLS